MEINEIVHQDSVQMDNRARDLRMKIDQDRLTARREMRKTIMQAAACMITASWVLYRLVKRK